MMRLSLLTAAFAIVVVFVQGFVGKAAATIDPLAIIMRFQDLQFTGDVDGALALFTDDAVVSRGLCAATLCRGKAAIRPEIARVAAI